MCFAKKHKKGQKKMQGNNTKAVSACAEAIKDLGKPKEVKTKISKGGSHKLSQLAYITDPKRGVSIAEGLRLCQPKANAKAQTKFWVAAAALAQA
uniref:Ribosomal protein L29 n=1 Tax=Myotis myotis TaxID=51298 RepID=A0A7J8A0Z3_MYOMY|nr:hypothetical protein mMyoMyo1_016799 [Myotis myotis]